MNQQQENAVVAVLMGSHSDWPVVKEAVDTLKDYAVPVEAHVMSAHRTPDEAAEFARTAASRGVKVIIAAAGSAAHLAGVVAAHTTLPVIGIPIASSTLNGLDALLSTLQMPGGIPVATVAIGSAGAVNAALLAVQILAIYDATLQERLCGHKATLRRKVMDADARLQEELARSI